MSQPPLRSGVRLYTAAHNNNGDWQCQAKRRVSTLLALGLSAMQAQAIPVLFEFSGTVNDTINFDPNGRATYDFSLTGQAFVASILVETDGLVRSLSTSSSATTLMYRDSAATSDPTDWITSTLSIGGMSYDVARHPGMEGCCAS